MDLIAKMGFIAEVDRLKGVLRQTLNYHERRHENAAEHSWHLAMAVLQFHNYSNQPVDILKCLKMALIHDLVEIDAGDTFIYADKADKFEQEIKAAERIFGLLPQAEGNDLKLLWLEFEAGETAESKFVRALDRFLPMYSNILSRGYSWRNHKVRSEQIIAKNKPVISGGASRLWDITENFLRATIPNFEANPWLS
jgi:putative hydrolases of HD superfamily